jgi:hypothetical protein
MAQLVDGGSRRPWHDALTDKARRSDVGRQHDGADQEEEAMARELFVLLNSTWHFFRLTHTGAPIPAQQTANWGSPENSKQDELIYLV